MTEITERDPLLIRGLILEEFGRVQTQMATNPKLWRSVTSRVHKRLSEVMGEDYVDYPEFEFWFARFLQGNFDWGYDRSSDPKPQSLADLPLGIFENVGEYLDIVDRLRLSDVCKDFRAQVDNWDLKVDEIYYSNGNDWRVWQTSRPEPYCAADFGQNENDRSSSGFYRNPISFVMNILKHPKLRLEKLTIKREDKYWNALIKRLDETNRKLHVKNVEFRCRYSSEIDLHFMVPGVLEEIKMFLWNPTREEFYEIIESEQCQVAKMVYIVSPTPTSEFPLEALYNCPRFTLRLRGTPADDLKSKFLKTLMEYGKVQKCVLYISKYPYAENHSQIMNYFNEPEAMVPHFPSLRRYPIPETNEFYELEYREEGNLLWDQPVRLERKQ
ncbi:hypothetical protein GCK72_021055 [Caenorhabditis remanei]|uniref:F-box domain-containing protein n=1 Tax=Caenorhabditis remanei TaxID=31234 RepID=A0A6A5GIZ4_CAERE|nr:hypothetical protein GCK72_021055 [Caenorhabditis remanei]KAF1754492.1 hypothetical protein GCK72_021055 [Caenorhabditis remanei]